MRYLGESIAVGCGGGGGSDVLLVFRKIAVIGSCLLVSQIGQSG
jgi:hypothetical protein